MKKKQKSKKVEEEVFDNFDAEREDFMDFCSYCKEKIGKGQTFVTHEDGKIEHVECFNEDQGIVEELNFDREK